MTDPLRRALALAARGRATTAPNPNVGAVLVRDGSVVGEGWHRRAGEPHAEVHALAAAGEAARGATLYVTLEPCAHHGRTPPCADALIAAGVARVVACHRDPDPRTAGAGFARLAAAGIAVEVGARADEAMALNLPYLVPVVLGRPAVTLKWAMTLDGRIATASGESRWITGVAARRASLLLREEHGAILVGSGTVLADDPRLTRRLGRADGPILRVVLDRRLRTPAAARLFDEPGPVVVYTAGAPDAERARELSARGAEIVPLAEPGVAAVVRDLAARGVRSLLVEGGAGVAGAFVDAGLWDRVVVFAAPLLIGGERAVPAIGGTGVGRLREAGRLGPLRIARRGADLEIAGENIECSRALSSSVGV
jgi:diaminohydroxyphosphoribosylaminopyrimidine deaminase/5-amino-6-(5-phosphoribosylamino)uracil reductase